MQACKEGRATAGEQADMSAEGIATQQVAAYLIVGTTEVHWELQHS